MPDYISEGTMILKSLTQLKKIGHNPRQPNLSTKLQQKLKKPPCFTELMESLYATTTHEFGYPMKHRKEGFRETKIKRCF